MESIGLADYENLGLFLIIQTRGWYVFWNIAEVPPPLVKVCRVNIRPIKKKNIGLGLIKF